MSPTAAHPATAPLQASPLAAELSFPLGLPGFPAVDRFLLSPIARQPGPFHLLHAIGGDRVDLVVVPLEAVGDRIDAADVETVRQSLQIEPRSLLVLLVVTLPAKGSGHAPTVNLRAPIFVDVDRRIAVQSVLPQGRYPFRQPLAA